MQLRDAPMPLVDDGKALVKIHSCGLNYAEVIIRSGFYPDAPAFPFIAGYEFAGVVEKSGMSGRLEKGTRVLGVTYFGAQAEYISVNEDQLFSIPDSMSFEEAAAIPVNYLTAYFALYRLGNLQTGERVLIHSCAGGVGTAAVQLALAKGAQIFGTTSAPHKIEYLKSIGVHHPINYRLVDFADTIRNLTNGKGVNIILDPIGGKVFRKSLRLLTDGGRIICYGVVDLLSGGKRNLPKILWKFINLPKVKVLDLIQNNKGVFGLALNRLVKEIEVISAPLQELIDLYIKGVIKPQIRAIFPADKASQAHQLLESGQSTGKIILRFDS